MRRTAATLVILAVAFLGAQRLSAALAGPRQIHARPISSAGRTPTRPAVATAATEPDAPSPNTQARAGFPSLILAASDDRAGVARRWVAAMWTRQPGDPPFAWLERVANITTPGLAAHLHVAIPTPDDAQVVSSGVQIDGVYPDALDPNTLTVTCVAHLITTTGPLDEPCAITLTLTRGPEGRLLVAAVI